HELFRTLVVLERRAPVEPRDLHRPRDNGGERCLEVERRADRLSDLAERGELAHRALQLGGARLQLAEETRVLDGYYGLIREGWEKGDLLLRKRSRFTPPDIDHP